jgi:short subunit dehydrogenase-like uncharacterized protein
MRHDIVVHGATGFVGRLVAGHLARHAPRGVSIALAGRSRERLEQVRRDLGRDAAEWPLIVADSTDAAALRALAEQAKVVASTVGPYRAHGLRLVDACIAARTHYLDLAGEVLFVRESVERHERAREAGVRIVHSCGFDSIPSDLGVLLLHEAAGDLGPTTLAVAALRGGFSGGTLASLKGQLDEITTDQAARRAVADPYALGGSGPPVRDPARVTRHRDLGWTGPFVMATYNSRLVRRSHGLLGYGPDFAYREVQRYKDPLTALAATSALGALAGGLAFKPTRAVLDRVLPAPGDGPGEEARRAGFFRMEIHGAGRTVTVAGKGDPGYAATAVMMGESAFALAAGRGLPDRFGVLTPASGIGSALVDRLRQAGMTLDVAVNAR